MSYNNNNFWLKNLSGAKVKECRTSHPVDKYCIFKTIAVLHSKYLPIDKLN